MIEVVNDLGLVSKAHFFSFLEFLFGDGILFFNVFQVYHAERGSTFRRSILWFCFFDYKSWSRFSFFNRLLVLLVRLGLGVSHLCVNTILNLDEFVMSTVFHNLAFLHHDNAIGIFHSGESMGNDKRCHTSQFSLHLVNGSLHFCLVLLVQSARSFVED